MKIMQKEYEVILKKIFNKIPKSMHNHLTLIGSVNLLLQGVDVITKKDIDLATDYETVRNIRKLFEDDLASNCLEKKGDKELPFAYVFYQIEGYEVEFFDTVDFGASYYKGHIDESTTEKLVLQDDLEINGLSLEEELKVYKIAGKIEKIKKIEEALNSR
jgi:hypothetical protein